MNIFLNKRQKRFTLTDFSAILYCYTDHMYLHHSFLSSKLLYLHLHCVSLICHLGALCMQKIETKEVISYEKCCKHNALAPTQANYQPSWWRQQVSLKRRYISIVHFSIKFQQTVMLFCCQARSPFRHVQ